ncbi:RhoGAP domain-containing protein [Colletotrichum graminicola]|uniref:RhoGAP domain-containing protein n=1 Tax=Colletotrichum graminicola (strain M1.001 / M2 / FGSC 10212) TaxID=645133 RepID=E3QWN7_COLGM|nr:RhoGAP domain-containing protein [Colletotrichum graminicola M1.001]EFQ35275.1 RhoGAP domain-containing protein [Colletotrichum graminicola M1.001]WDK14503.1 RhoGAP domain-containing protein [Colletotrichum graminicola]
MGRKPAPQPLTLSGSHPAADQPEDVVPRSAETLTSSVVPPSAGSKSQSSPRSPRSPFRFTPKRPSASGKQSLQLTDEHRNFEDDDDEFQQYQPISSALHRASEDTPPRQHHQQYPISPRTHRPDEPPRKASKSGGFLFNFSKTSKSSHSIASSPSHSPSHPPRQNQQQAPIPNTDSGGQSMSRGPDNAPMGSDQPTQPTVVDPYAISPAEPSYTEHAVQKPAPTLPSRSDASLASVADYDPFPTTQHSSTKKSKPKPFGILSRNRSLRDKDGSSSRDKQPSPVAVSINEPEPSHPLTGRNYSINTPPAASDRSLKEMVNSTGRNRSEDHASPRDMANKENQKEKDHHHPRSNSSSQNGGFFGGLKSGRDMISNRLFGKNARSGSTTEKEPVIDDEHYVLKTINLPLVEQTRRTRISKRLEDSRDKTEFWMPAFPWRAIDYLNYKGCDVEGLYRVPGSGPQIKKWQRRFDEEYDVNLFEQPDLYDINIIGSMLKAWLRELPDELFPKAAQERVARECAGYETVPPLLVEELSNLSPFNYYLLFAITCHLSLLLAHSDKNKMDFRNLCICFQPCMKIDAFCFRFLVCDWRDCWKGCKNEAKFIEQEYQLFDQPPPRGLSEPRKISRETTEEPGQESIAAMSVDERAGSSSESSKQSSASTEQQAKDRRQKKKPLQLSESNGSVASSSTISTALTIDSGRDVPRGGNDLRPLSPIKPLSPLGF